ncbi:MAG: hypothetical protein GY822_12355 [Deltaproteobacteria bacterium]|nr:hypothetical protein [Deltaproteobacteria bacterium]
MFETARLSKEAKVVTSRTKTSCAAGPDGQNIEQKGLSAAVLRKNEQGEWCIVIDDPHAQFLLEQAS